MVSDLECRSQTLNLPYCFSRSALDISDAFVDACGDLANDIEVGVYFSKLGGSAAAWHCDNNHNFTIQLCGQKDWCVPCPASAWPCPGSRHGWQVEGRACRLARAFAFTDPAYRAC